MNCWAMPTASSSLPRICGEAGKPKYAWRWTPRCRPNCCCRALKAFARLAPQTRVHVTEVVLSGADQALLQRQAGLAVGTRIPTGHFGERLLDIPFVAVAHPAHPLHQLGRELTAEDLSREMQVVLRDSGQANPRDDGWLGATLRWTVSHMEAMRMLVAGGLGFAWLPQHLVTEPRARGYAAALAAARRPHPARAAVPDPQPARHLGPRAAPPCRRPGQGRRRLPRPSHCLHRRAQHRLIRSDRPDFRINWRTSAPYHSGITNKERVPRRFAIASVRNASRQGGRTPPTETT
ncbi:LysR substrate-binding domain-containing protein [Cupriavidus nantongensis]|uniref:LysR substrate-binding domain-containing protein n=1 Tax=Cupriavidus nantongensis TaxID=1796606 RepID=UPI00358FFFBF